MGPIRTILHPTDFSERSGYAFQLACALARDYGARLIVLHVAEPPVIPYGGVMTPPPPPRDSWRALEEQLHRIQAPEPTVHVEHRLEEGGPVAEILRVARETTADLIVMGTHGRTGLGRLLMGSVAEQVVRKAPCPVLTVKTPFPEAAPPSAKPAAELKSAVGVP
jgi:nucleotide-binding universal stress UspA family protein